MAEEEEQDPPELQHYMACWREWQRLKTDDAAELAAEAFEVWAAKFPEQAKLVQQEMANWASQEAEAAEGSEKEGEKLEKEGEGREEPQHGEVCSFVIESVLSIFYRCTY